MAGGGEKCLGGGGELPCTDCSASRAHCPTAQCPSAITTAIRFQFAACFCATLQPDSIIQTQPQQRHTLLATGSTHSHCHRSRGSEVLTLLRSRAATLQLQHCGSAVRPTSGNRTEFLKSLRCLFFCFLKVKSVTLQEQQDPHHIFLRGKRYVFKTSNRESATFSYWPYRAPAVECGP